MTAQTFPHARARHARRNSESRQLNWRLLSALVLNVFVWIGAGAAVHSGWPLIKGFFLALCRWIGA